MRRLLFALIVAGLLPTPAAAQITATFLQQVDDATDGTVYSYAAQNLGAAASDRYITVVSFGRRSGTSSCLGPSVTIGGVSATLVVTQTATASNCNVGSIHRALVPTGTTGTIALTYGATFAHNHIAVYRSTGSQMLGAASSGSSNAGSPTGTITIQAGGYGIGGSMTSSLGATATWTGLTEVHETVWTGAPSNVSTGAMLTPGTVQSGITVTATWDTSVESVGLWAAWAPIANATSPTHYVTPGGSGSSSCTSGSPCTLTRAFALAGTATIPAGSWVSVAAGIYNQAPITTTAGGSPGYPIRFVGAGTDYSTGSRLTGTRTSFNGASWSLCASMTYTYCATFDEAANYTVGTFAQRPGPSLTTWVPISVADGPATSGPLYTFDEPVSYGERFSPADVEARHCTFFHNTATNTLYIHPCREVAPADSDQYYGGPDLWGTIEYEDDYLTLEGFSIEHTNGQGIRIQTSANGIVMDDIRMLGSQFWGHGIDTVVTDLLVKEVNSQGEPGLAGCYSEQYGGTGAASRSCFNYNGDGWCLLIGDEGTGYSYRGSYDRITVERCWNGIGLSEENTLDHAVVWGIANHATFPTGSNVTVRNSVVFNSQDASFTSVEDWENHTYENNLFYGGVLWWCGIGGASGGAVCPTGWTFRNNIVASMVTDHYNEPVVTRDCNVYMPRSSGADLLKVQQAGGSTVDYATLAAIQAAKPTDDNSIELPYTRWYDGSIFANWNSQHDYPIDLTLATGGAAALTVCGAVAGPDTLVDEETPTPTAARFRWRVP